MREVEGREMFDLNSLDDSFDFGRLGSDAAATPGSGGSTTFFTFYETLTITAHLGSSTEGDDGAVSYENVVLITGPESSGLVAGYLDGTAFPEGNLVFAFSETPVLAPPDAGSVISFHDAITVVTRDDGGTASVTYEDAVVDAQPGDAPAAQEDGAPDVLFTFHQSLTVTDGLFGAGADITLTTYQDVVLVVGSNVMDMLPGYIDGASLPDNDDLVFILSDTPAPSFDAEAADTLTWYLDEIFVVARSGDGVVATHLDDVVLWASADGSSMPGIGDPSPPADRPDPNGALESPASPPDQWIVLLQGGSPDPL